MNKLNILQIAICDDDEQAINIIASCVKGFLEKKGIKTRIHKFIGTASLIDMMNNHNFELLLLDIEMPTKDGISFGKELRDMNNMIDIIYISNREDKVFESLKVGPVGFIRKGYLLEDIPDVMHLYLKKIEKQNQKLIVTTKDAVLTIFLMDIMYIEGDGNYQTLHLIEQKESIVIRKSMQEIEEELKSKGFIRVHKGYIINYQHIKLIGMTDVLLTTEERIPISRRKIQEVKSIYLQLMKDNSSSII